MPSIDAFRLDGRVAIVTGASSGFGAAIGRLFAQSGARLVLAARREHRLREVAGSLAAPNGCVLAVQTDVTDEAQVRRMVAMTLEIASVYPLQRLGTPDDVAYAALYLASDASNWVTGACLMLDGGLTVG